MLLSGSTAPLGHGGGVEYLDGKRWPYEATVVIAGLCVALLLTIATAKRMVFSRPSGDVPVNGERASWLVCDSLVTARSTQV